MSDTQKKITFQGEIGAYSHLASKSIFPDAKAIACLNFKEAIENVSKGIADAAIIPVENSQWGRVSDVHFLFLETNLIITGEYFHRVKHQLLGLKGCQLSDITHVYSHPQALGQCAQKINDLRIMPVAAYDTAGAAKKIAHEENRAHAAIASELAAEIYGLDILKADFEDKSHNTTRFIIMRRIENTKKYDDNIQYISAFIFKTRHIPAALYKVLGGFATNNVNMIRLESYVNPSEFRSSYFYAEVEGHTEYETVKRAFEELNFFATEFKILGSFPASNFRTNQSN